MATLLYRLGKASFDNAWRVLIIWLVAFVAIGGGGIALGGATDEQFDIPGSPSQAAFDRLASVFPGFGTASAQAVIVAPEGQRLDSPDNTAAIEELAAAIAADEIIDDTISPFDEFAGRALSDDGRYALLQVQFAVSDDDITDEMLDTLVSYRSVFSDSDLIVEFGGNLFQDQGVHLTIAEVFGVAFAGLVLIVTFRSFRPAWAPLASAVVGVGISIGLILMAAGATVVSSSAPLLAVMLGLAVGIDYSLFILQRHRTQLATGLGARAYRCHCGRDRRQRGGLRRCHRGDCPARTFCRRHPLPQRDGRLRCRRCGGRNRCCHHVASGTHGVDGRETPTFTRL